jgi:hypothetical protein
MFFKTNIKLSPPDEVAHEVAEIDCDYDEIACMYRQKKPVSASGLLLIEGPRAITEVFLRYGKKLQCVETPDQIHALARKRVKELEAEFAKDHPEEA